LRAWKILGARFALCNLGVSGGANESLEFLVRHIGLVDPESINVRFKACGETQGSRKT